MPLLRGSSAKCPKPNSRNRPNQFNYDTKVNKNN